MEKEKIKNIAFNSAASLPVYHRFRELFKRVKAERESATGKKYFAWMLLGELMDRWEQFDRIKVIPFSPDMELSDFVQRVVKSAVDDIASKNEIE